MGGSSPKWGSNETAPYNGPAGQSGLGIYTANLINDFAIENLAFEENTASSGPHLFGVEQTSVGRMTVKNSAFRGSGVGAYMASGSIPIFDGCTWYKCTQINHVHGAGSGNTLIKDCFINSSAATIQSVGKSTINNTKIKSAGAVSNSVLDTVFNNCIIQVDTRIATNGSAGALGTNVFNNCSFTGTAPLTTVHTTRSSDLQITKLNRPNNVDLDYRLYNYYFYGQTTTALRKNGITSLRIKPNVANQAFNTYFSIPAFAGVQQIIKCNLRFDSTYGTANPPTISFVGAGVSTLCACAATADVWQTFDLTLNPSSTDDIAVTVTGQSSSILGYVYLDGLPIDPYIQTARWYGFETDKNAFRTVNALTTLTENQVSALEVVTNLDHLYDAASYWTINNPLSTSYQDLFTVNGTVLDFGNKNITVYNTGSAFVYTSGSNTITINAANLSGGTNFDTLQTTGTVTLATGIISNIKINANISQPSPINFTGVEMLGNSVLTYATNEQRSLEYTNCTITSAQNTGTGIITIKKTNSTITESDAKIFTYVPTYVHITALSGGYVAIYDNSGTRRYYTNTNQTIELPATATGTWTYKVARYGYDLIQGNFTMNGGGSVSITPNYITDEFVTQTDVSLVSAYADLNTTAKIHDYLSYVRTTSAGIDLGELHTQSFGTLTFNAGLTLDAAAASVFSYANNVITLNCSELDDDIVYYMLGDFTLANNASITDTLRIRANNLDSEILFTNLDSYVFYPSIQNRDSNTNISLTGTDTIYRYLYGSQVGSLTLSNYIYLRITIDAITLLVSNAIAAGTTEIDLGTAGNLQTILNNQRIINTGVQNASKLIPHTQNI